MTYLYIVAGAVVGAPLRYFLGTRVQDWTGLGFPWGTLVVNVAGCFLMGLIATIADERGAIGREGRLLLITGFLGSFTTFSAFGWETLALFREDDYFAGAANVLLSLTAGLVAVGLGIAAGRTGT